MYCTKEYTLCAPALAFLLTLFLPFPRGLVLHRTNGVVAVKHRGGGAAPPPAAPPLVAIRSLDFCFVFCFLFFVFFKPTRSFYSRSLLFSISRRPDASYRRVASRCNVVWHIRLRWLRSSSSSSSSSSQAHHNLKPKKKKNLYSLLLLPTDLEGTLRLRIRRGRPQGTVQYVRDLIYPALFRFPSQVDAHTGLPSRGRITYIHGTPCATRYASSIRPGGRAGISMGDQLAPTKRHAFKHEVSGHHRCKAE